MENCTKKGQTRCDAVNKRHPECDCRWCVFNKEFNQAGER